MILFLFIQFLSYQIAVISDDQNMDKDQKPGKMHGKYSLYIKEIDKGWELNWMTPGTEKGIYRISQGDEILFEGETNESFLHRAVVEKMEDPAVFEFGGTDSGISKIRLNPITKPHPSEIKNIDTVYVFGDVHGQFDIVVRVLQNGGLIDDDLHWIGGSAHLVFDGDVMDRGPDVIRLLWYIYELEQEAQADGGNVHLILGNHEIMVMSNDLRYLHVKERQMANLLQISYGEFVNPTQSLLGQWLASKPSIVKMDNLLFAHGGVITNFGDFSAKRYNTEVLAFMKEPEFTRLLEKELDPEKYDMERWEFLRSFFYDDSSPYWFRGYTQQDTLDAYLDFIHQKFNTKIHIVGHTTFPTITERYGGKLIATNVEPNGSELLMLMRKGKKSYRRYKIDIEGNRVEL